MFGVQELATAVQHGINVVTVVFDNGGFGNVRRDQTNVYDGRLLGSELRNPDFVRLAESFGADATTASTADELGSSVAHALEAERPAVIVVSGSPGHETSPWPFIHPDPPIQV